MGKFKSWKSYRNFAYRVRQEARFIRTAEDDDFLREVVRTSESRTREMPVGFRLWRAQLGCDWEPEIQAGEYLGDRSVVYSPSRMKPLQDRAREGRANPKGIPVLYLSTHRETAMSEVRLWVGSLVSCARFKTIRTLRIVDCSVREFRGIMFFPREPDAPVREKAAWTQINEAFSRPTTPADDTDSYVPTQVIAELFKNNGFDGIAYKSEFGSKGYNTVLFDPADAEVTSCTLFEAKSLKFEFEQTDNTRWVIEGGTEKTTLNEQGKSV